MKIIGSSFIQNAKFRPMSTQRTTRLPPSILIYHNYNLITREDSFPLTLKIGATFSQHINPKTHLF